jgi:NAD+ kinase
MAKIGLFIYPNNPLPEQIKAIRNIVEKTSHQLIEIRDVIPEALDWLIALGGDGTILRAAVIARELGCPLLGISAGHLGFLAEITIEQLPDALTRMERNDFHLDSRRWLAATIEGETFLALNDLAIKGTHLSMIELDVSLAETPLTTYKADGLIVSTSTGSTAYNLAAGGPIIFPDTEALIMTPICPHSLTNRPLVLSPKETINIESKNEFLVSIDGSQERVSKGPISLHLSNEIVSFVRLHPASFVSGLRHKLGWSGKI